MSPNPGVGQEPKMQSDKSFSWLQMQPGLRRYTQWGGHHEGSGDWQARLAGPIADLPVLMSLFDVILKPQN